MPEWNFPSDEELDAQIETARARADAERDKNVRALSARYEAATGRVIVELTNGCAFAFPAELGEGLRGASADDLAQIEISPLGTGLLWRSLDAGLTVEGLLAGIFGTKRWMAETLGRAGGSAKSAVKSAAARANGRKGGRPRKAQGG